MFYQGSLKWPAIEGRCVLKIMKLDDLIHLRSAAYLMKLCPGRAGVNLAPHV